MNQQGTQPQQQPCRVCTSPSDPSLTGPEILAHYEAGHGVDLFAQVEQALNGSTSPQGG